LPKRLSIAFCQRKITDANCGRDFRRIDVDGDVAKKLLAWAERPAPAARDALITAARMPRRRHNWLLGRSDALDT
jgi:hypothetical protein